jgi:hypothetical protein
MALFEKVGDHILACFAGATGHDDPFARLDGVGCRLQDD